METRSTLVRLVGKAVLHPSLALLMLRAAWRFRAKDWYRRAPFIPVPPADYMAWRAETAWGDAGHIADAESLGRYLRWVRRMGSDRR